MIKSESVSEKGKVVKSRSYKKIRKGESGG